MPNPTLSSSNRSQVESSHTRSVVFVKLGFNTGTIRLNSSHRDYEVGGETYLGDGRLRSIGDIDSAPNLRQEALELVVSGLDPEIIAGIKDGSYHYRSVDIYIGFRNDKDQLVADAHPLLQDGLLSQPAILLGTKMGEVTITVENRAILLKKAHSVMATDAMQRHRSPGDTGLSLIHTTEDLELIWGETPENWGEIAPARNLPPERGHIRQR